MDIETQLATVNSRLKTALIGVAVCQIKNRLYLRATLPAKPNSAKTKPHQQWLSLGIYANREGFKRAEAEAHKLGGLIACKEFKWEIYLKTTEDSPVSYVKDWVDKFEKFYFETHQRNHQTETTWKIDYLNVFNKLPQWEGLSSETILKVITSTAPDTKTRKRTCMALGALAKFALININLKSYAGRGGTALRKYHRATYPATQPLPNIFIKLRMKIGAGCMGC